MLKLKLELPISSEDKISLELNFFETVQEARNIVRFVETNGIIIGLDILDNLLWLEISDNCIETLPNALKDLYYNDYIPRASKYIYNYILPSTLLAIGFITQAQKDQIDSYKKSQHEKADREANYKKYLELKALFEKE